VRVLFDQGTPVPIRKHLSAHQVVTAFEQGWSTLRNGELLLAAEAGGFEVLLTTDTNIKYQQNLTNRAIAIVVLGKARWPRIKPVIARVAVAVDGATPGSYSEVEIP
jgi:hypothetical protein